MTFAGSGRRSSGPTFRGLRERWFIMYASAQKGGF